MPRPQLAITGLGIATAIGQGKADVQRGLRAGHHAFQVMRRPGRQHATTAFLGADLAPLRLPDGVPPRSLRTASLSCQAALVTAAEAWAEAQLDAVAATRIGLIVGGSNLQQRELVVLHDEYRDRFAYLRPHYGQMFLDTDIAAMCSEQLGVRGIAQTVGGASASGHLAIIEAARAVESGRVDACIAVGGLMDLSYWECQGFRALGAMGSDRYASQPDAACRPFDRDHDGFIFGESCGAVVIERLDAARTPPYATLAGWSWVVDGRRSTDPSLGGELEAIRVALEMAGRAARDIDYVNPHGTGSAIGDATELAALAESGLTGARLNATKSLLGHGLTAAGTVEVIATCLQMRGGFLHPTRNLDAPIDPAFGWVAGDAVAHDIHNALTLSFGFGGISSAICLRSRARPSTPLASKDVLS